MKNSINIAVIGFGTIGSSVVRLLMERRSLFRERTGIDLNLAAVCDKDLASRREVNVPKSILTRDVDSVIEDPDIDVLVELIGGVHPAKEIILKALSSGKHIVTANKLLLATEGDVIFKKAEEMEREISFEAAVAGGVPVINSIRDSLIANTFSAIMGILNGTSNYILSRMSSEGYSFKDCLKEAQRNGYAERDSSLDIKGLDAAHKLAILTLLAFGRKVSMRDIHVEGIERISPVDIQYAKEWGYAVKPIAVVKRDGKKLELRVHPALLPSKYLLASVSGIYNAVFIEADLVGKQVYYGEGAGKLPTASAVLSDIMDIASTVVYGRKSANIILPKRLEVEGLKKMDDVVSRFYVHFSTIDKPGVLARIAEILGDNDISISSVVQKQRDRGRIVPIVMLTHDAREKDMQRALNKIDRLPVVKRKSVLIRVEG